MASINIAGDTSGTITLSAPLVSGSNTATLPVATGELSMLGTNGQTWQNVLASRTRGVDYTNNTGKPIFVTISAQNISAQALTLTVGGVVAARASLQGTSGEVNLSCIVPTGAVYRMDNSVSGTIHQWAELR
jgi:hypothetical protein